MREIEIEQGIVITERIWSAFGDVIGGNEMIMKRVVFGVIMGDITWHPDDNDDDGEV